MNKFLLAITSVLFISAFSATTAGNNNLRGDRVGWARLKTPSPYWNRHADADPALMRFLRDSTSLNIDPTWYNADAENLSQMCAYPFLFSQGIDTLRSSTSKTNLAEYIRRDGFLLIDACINGGVTRDPDVFLAQQMQLLAEILPEARVVMLPVNHNIYRCYFQISDGKPPHTYDNNAPDPRWTKHGLYGIQIGSRLAGVITLSGLQCGWAGVPAPPRHNIACMKMLVNIYIYSMMQGSK